MARINFDDDVESQDEFWRLLPLVGGDRDKALGKLVRFFRIAQKRFGHNEVISKEELESQGLAEMIQSGWAVEVGDGYQTKGAAKYFAWYRQKVEAGKKGGRPKQPDDNREEPDANRSKAPVNPLALVPVPALVKEKEDNTRKRVSARTSPKGPIPELAGIGIVDQHLANVSHEVQRVWLEQHKNPAAIREEILKAIAWKTAKGVKRKNFGLFITNWLSDKDLSTYAPASPQETNLVDDDLIRQKAEAAKKANLERAKSFSAAGVQK